MKRRKRSKALRFESLESRDLLTTWAAQGVEVSYTAAAETKETGTTFQFDIRLTSAPNDVVGVLLGSSDLGEGRVNAVIASFNQSNWSAWQTFTVTGQPDNVDDGNAGYLATIGPINSPDNRFDDLNPPDIALTNIDIDCQANPDANLNVLEDTVTTFNIKANDTDLSPTTYLAVTSATVFSGNVSVEVVGDQLVVTPAPDQWGYSFIVDYVLTNGHGDDSTATASGWVSGVNDAPVAVDDGVPDRIEVDEDVLTPVLVRTNDIDIDNYILDDGYINNVSGIQNGTVPFYSWYFRFLSSPNYSGPAQVDYQLGDYDDITSTLDQDGKLSNVATAYIDVLPVNDPPTNADYSFSTEEEAAHSFFVPVNDGDADFTQVLTSTVVVAPAHGNLEIGQDGYFIYVPEDNYNGGDVFEYFVTDDAGAGKNPNLSSGIGVPPAGTPAPRTLDVLANDTDIDFPDDVHAVQSATDGTYGTVSISGTSVTYTPNGTYALIDTFSYTLVDSGGATDTAVVTVSFSWSPALTAARPATVATPSGVVFASDEEFQLAVAPIVREAAARWAATGIDASALSGARVKLADLDGLLLGLDIAGRSSSTGMRPASAGSWMPLRGTIGSSGCAMGSWPRGAIARPPDGWTCSRP